MGQNSSQVQPPSAEQPPMEHPAKSTDKRRKSRTGKRQSEEQHSIDQEEESARALLLMREGAIHDSRAPYYQDDLVASQQLIAESSPMRPLELANGDDSVVRSSEKPRNHKTRISKKKKRNDTFTFTGSEDGNDEAEWYPHIPSTPPGQVLHSSPPPYRPTISQSAHALDDIPTDDEAVASYMQEYEKENESVDPPAAPEHDIYEFSQQPPDASDQEDYGTAMYSTYKLPKQAYFPPKALAKPKKRKRGRISTPDEEDDQEQPLVNGEGQHILNLDLGAINELFDDDDWANMSGAYQDNDMPIDPELHSMSALPPAVDLSQLDNGGEDAAQKKKRNSKQNGSAPPSKRRRAEEVSIASNRQVPFYSPYALDHDQENLQDRVLPGFEDLQRRSSPELGSPFMEDIANRGLEYLNDRASPGQSAQRKKEVCASKANDSKKLRAVKELKSSPKTISKNGGQFTAAEAEKLDKFRDAYCDANSISIEKFNSQIQSTIRNNVEVKCIFDELHEVLPYRPRISVQKFCRRRYHNFPARGKWTTEEDEMLKKAFAAKPNQWKAIGEMLDRMGEDCRDRYRNYLLNSENRNREAWTNEEVQSLCKAILDCRQAMKDERRQVKMEKYGEDAPGSDFDSDQEAQDMKLVNWQSVSDHMGGVRSRLQCRLKWLQLKEWEQKNLVQSAIDAKGFEGRKSIKTKNPWRMKRASKKVANMRTGDQYALLQAILDSSAATEDNIPWKTIGDVEFQSTWNSADKKAAWTNLKLHVPGSDSMDYRAIAKGLRKRILADGRDELDEKWDPQVHGDVSAKKPKRKRKAKEKQGDDEEEASGKKNRTAKRVQKLQDKSKSNKSDEHVHDSDQEEVADSADEPQGYNRYTALPRADATEANMDAGVEEASTTDDNQDREVYADDSEVDSLFNEKGDNDGDQPMADRDVGEELTSRVHLLQHA